MPTNRPRQSTNLKLFSGNKYTLSVRICDGQNPATTRDFVFKTHGDFIFEFMHPGIKSVNMTMPRTPRACAAKITRYIKAGKL